MSGPRAGFSLAEAVVALAVSLVLLGAATLALLGALRRSSHSRAARLARHGVRAAAMVLASELRDASPASGDLVAASDTAVTIRAMRSFAVVCAVRPPDAVVVADSLTFALRALDPARDSVVVFREGDAVRTDDDAWVGGAAVAAAADRCPSGASGTRVTLAGADLSGVAAGAPLRSFEIQDYRLYRDGDGRWWLGVRGPAAAGWSATSPVAGPLRPRAGLAFRLLGADGLQVGSPAQARLVEVIVRAAAGPGARGEDSLRFRVPLRND